MRALIQRYSIAIIIIALLAALNARAAEPTVEQTEYMGWKGAWRLSNPVCELIVVPQIGRVMSFALKGGRNALWINPKLAGQSVEKDDGVWHNFGGDKLWPTPQDLWFKYTGKKGWPPPYDYDGGPFTAEQIPGGVRISSALNSHFGARCVREFLLDPVNALVRVRSRHEKIEGPPVEMALWTITQTQPKLALMPLGAPVDGQGYRAFNSKLPAATLSRSVIALANHSQAQKAGVFPDAQARDGWVACVFDDTLFLQSHTLSKEGGYPDQNCHAEIFTAKLENAYVELELLTPTRTLNPGEALSDEVLWQLLPVEKEAAADPEKAAAVAREAHQAHSSALGTKHP